MADLNYVSPLTSDLTDYYTKTEVDELQQGDENRFATQAQITAGDNEVKGWVASQGYLTQHQSLQNYATKEYVNAAIEDIEVEGGVKIRVVSNLPANPETNVIYLTRRSSEEDDNVYNEWIYVEDIEDFELIGDTSTGVLPDLTDYATKSYVDTAVAGIDVPADAEDIAYDNTDSGLGSTDVQAAIDEICDNIPSAIGNEIDAFSATLATVATSGDYEDLSNKPTIPSLTGYATTTYVDDAVAAIDIPDVSDFVETSDLASVATSGSYNDLTDKPTIPDVSSLTAADIGYSNPDRYPYYENINTVNKVINLLENQLDGKVSSSSLATVATSGSYNDLTDKPTIPAAPDLSSYATKSELSAKVNAADLAAVATTGSYNDLSNKPTIPSTSGLASETYVDNAIAAIKGSEIDNDMNWIDEGMAKASAIDEINNNVSAAGLSGDYDDLTNKPTIPTVPTNVSSFTNDAGYLTSHQDISGKANIADLATVATTGDYDDLTNKPTIPVLPTLATVATSGDYDDLQNKPTIPSLSGYATETWVGQQGYLTQHQDISGKANSADLATVATSGSYNDLTNKPVIPTSDEVVGLDLFISGMFSNIGYNKTPYTVSPNNDSAAWLVDFKAGLDSGKWLFLNGPQGKTITASDLGVSDFSITTYNYDTNNTTRTEFNKGAGTTSWTFPSDNSGAANSGYFARTGRNTFFYVYGTNSNMKNYWLFKFLQSRLTYSNTTSGLTATTVQGAIDELAASAGSSVGYTYDSTTKTVSLSGVSDDNL